MRLCVPKTSSGDDFGFGGLNSLFLRQNSLFNQNNSLFCCVGGIVIAKKVGHQPGAADKNNHRF